MVVGALEGGGGDFIQSEGDKPFGGGLWQGFGAVVFGEAVA